MPHIREDRRFVAPLLALISLALAGPPSALAQEASADARAPGIQQQMTDDERFSLLPQPRSIHDSDGWLPVKGGFQVEWLGYRNTVRRGCCSIGRTDRNICREIADAAVPAGTTSPPKRCSCEAPTHARSSRAGGLQTFWRHLLDVEPIPGARQRGAAASRPSAGTAGGSARLDAAVPAATRPGSADGARRTQSRCRLVPGPPELGAVDPDAV